MEFPRLLNLGNFQSSILLLGPRMTGKSHLLAKYPEAVSFNLLDVEQEIKYKSSPKVFFEEISALPKGSLVLVDEIQRIPALLDYVQIGIEELGIRFLLSGSSARKLKREGANLLAGRALLFYLHPLSYQELGQYFNLEQILRYGSLPKVSDLLSEEREAEVRKLLTTYRQVYLQEEIKQEALTRNLGNFTRFLDVTVQYNAQQVVYQNIASSAQVPRSTVSNYFDILEDTLIADRLWEYKKSEKDKAKPKLYFFDCGVVRAIQNRLYDPPTPAEAGHLFENFIYTELKKIRDYTDKPHTFSYWNESQEIDFLIEKNGKIVMAIECKSGEIASLPSYGKFQQKHPDAPLYIASMKEQKPRKISEQITILHWKEVLEKYSSL